MIAHAWDDERLEAAFHARFDRPAPVTLERTVRASLAATRAARPGLIGRFSPIAAATTAVVVAAAIGVVAIGIGGFGPSGDRQTSPALPSAAATAKATGSDDNPDTAPAPPTSTLGLAVVDIRTGLSIRDAGTDDRELAVVGWYTPPPLSSCGPYRPAPTNPIQLRCPDEVAWLTEDAESLVHVTGNQQVTSAPHGVALNPDLDDLSQSWAPPLPVIGIDGGSTPAHVVMVGHFDDRRSRQCPPAEQVACQDRFVVDKVAWVDGAVPPPSRLSLLNAGVSPRSSIAEVQAIVAVEAPQSPELSMVVVDGPVGLASIEPSLTVRRGRDGLVDQPIVWISRLLESERISTYISVDGTQAIYEMNADGDAVSVGGFVGGAPAHGGWVPAGAVVVTLTSQVGAGLPPAQVAVVDHSGRLAGAREKGGPLPDLPSANDRGFYAFAEPGLPGRVHLTWAGGVCDNKVKITVRPEVASIVLDPGPQPTCDSMGVLRELVLDFAGSVDVPAIKLVTNYTIDN